MTRAIRLTGADIDDEHTELIYRIMQVVQKKGGDTSLKDITEIQADVHRQYQESQVKTHCSASQSRNDLVSSTNNNEKQYTMKDEHLTDLQQILDNAKEDAYKFYAKDNKAAGTRLRKHMMELKNTAQDVRVDVQQRKS